MADRASATTRLHISAAPPFPISKGPFSCLYFSILLNPSVVPPLSLFLLGLDFEFGGGIDELLCIPLISCSLKFENSEQTRLNYLSVLVVFIVQLFGFLCELEK
ncbi:hypothetical protein AAZV13_10G100900 [Glycine max]